MKAKITGQLNLPCEITVDDYHEFGTIHHYMDHVIPNIKVKEIGFSEDLGQYIGMIYKGNLKEQKNKDLFKYIKNKIQQEEKQFRKKAEK